MRLSFFSRGEPAPASTPVAPDDTTLPYDPNLVPMLMDEHRILRAMLQSVREAAKVRRYEVIKPLLNQFHTELKQHAQRKSGRCFAYIERHIKDHDSTLVRSMHASAAHTERMVSGFLQHYLSIPVGDANLRRFGRELDEAIAEFQQRLEFEETSLFPLYRPRDAY
ncbi:MAG TPA: hemerythrin domain-containing protein [Gammaproteobacteria bacterium]